MLIPANDSNFSIYPFYVCTTAGQFVCWNKKFDMVKVLSPFLWILDRHCRNWFSLYFSDSRAYLRKTLRLAFSHDFVLPVMVVLQRVGETRSWYIPSLWTLRLLRLNEIVMVVRSLSHCRRCKSVIAHMHTFYNLSWWFRKQGSSQIFFGVILCLHSQS